jgi:hypothetical protein
MGSTISSIAIEAHRTLIKVNSGVLRRGDNCRLARSYTRASYPSVYRQREGR